MSFRETFKLNLYEAMLVLDLKNQRCEQNQSVKNYLKIKLKFMESYGCQNGFLFSSE